MNPVLFDTAFWLTTLVIVVLLIAAAFFAGSETALTAASRGKLKARADRGSRGAGQALRLTEEPERMIGALLLGNNIVIILSASLATGLLTRMLGDGGVALAAVVMTALVLIFGEMLPKTIAITYAEAVSIRVAPLVRTVIVVFSPVVSLVRALVRGILGLFGIRPDPAAPVLALRDEILGAITLGHSEGAVEKEDRDRLLGALDLSDRAVEEVMRHRRQIEMIDADRSPDAIITQVLASPHSRLPVYRGSDDNILGVIHTKDLLREVDRLVRGTDAAPDGIAALDVAKIAMKPYFVPDTTTLDEQMREFLKRRTHFALVVDEYGGLKGLLTLEDILEEIVGEITDEFDVVDKDSRIARTGTDEALVDGAMTIRDLNRAMEWALPDEEANTVAGLVIHEAQTIPAEGQVFSFHGFRIEVVTRRENRITRLRLRRL
ncbi:MAG: HlyC/CorC family transporter [Pseudomonadota bacterium]